MAIGGADHIVSKKLYLSANNRSQSSLQGEAEQDSQTKLQNIKKSIKARLVGQDSNYKLVLFNDPTSGDRISALLSKENLDRLQEKFDKKNFFTREDGLIRLSGKAESYVSGWYTHITTGDVEAQKADLDKDGKFSESERELIKDGYEFEILEKGILNKGMVVHSVSTNSKADNTNVRTIEDLLDNFITQDQNLDGEISVKEHIEVTRGSLAETLKNILKSQENPLAKMIDNSNKAINEGIKTKKKNKLDISALEEAAKILAKIKRSGDLSSLSPQEQEIVRQYFAGEVERLKQQNVDSSVIDKHLSDKIQEFVEEVSSNKNLIFEAKA
ncbi:hypothetical protein [Helicobacter mesocricetorum]|uniref:hypothetical protein n=1 Tax=Helicobacter mesocricetorum TaxID=87012 RepID=UPI000CF09436|nr:hypothetical protein [Helicobacter mesocricetorum]